MSAEVGGGGNIEVSPWLKSMAVAPEYHPTLAEFQDPISYIFKIEKEASKYGICKIVPPVPTAPRKTVVSNLNKSLLARSNDPTFTTRQQQIGFCPRKHRPVQKPVWQSGERYTLAEFEAKAKNFEKNYLKKYAKKVLGASEMETLYWNAMVDKPLSVEYANDMPGSAFVARKSGGKRSEGALTVGETEWNMRRLSRDNLSLLRFMEEEIPGVTSPMVYVAMMFSWFAWHVEDHDLHSMNYLHLGSGKTWYGVPKEAAVAFEEVIREHGYGGEINPLVTFATLGQKTTVMSPEVLLNAGVPCCRLVQNAGEFVVTFPRAYHSGFSHGFNCGEATNIATPEWLRVAKEAAIRRAAINCPPMVSHFQLLYDLALSLCSRVPKSIAMEPRSSRLKDRKRGEGDKLIKELFFQDMMQNNDMLNILGKGSSIVLLPQNSLTHSFRFNPMGGFQSTTKSNLFPSLCSPDLELKNARYNACDESTLDRKQGLKQAKGSVVKRTFSSLFGIEIPSPAHAEETYSELKKASQCEQGLFSCVTCGILCFSCVAIVQPTEATAQYLMSADCSILNNLDESDNGPTRICDPIGSNTNLSLALVLRSQNGLSADQIQYANRGNVGLASDGKAHKEPSSLGLLALTYGNSSDSEEEDSETSLLAESCGISKSDDLRHEDANGNTEPNINCMTEISLQTSDSSAKFGPALATSKDGEALNSDFSDECNKNSSTLTKSNSLTHRFSRHQIEPQLDIPNSLSPKTVGTPISGLAPREPTTLPFSSRVDEDSSRLHVFCLQHAVQVVRQLSQFGGADVFLFCHPDYPKLESEAKKVAEDLESNHSWTEVSFREATDEDEEIICRALENENAIHGNGDWAVKLGINLFYSANLSRSPLYSKQMHYNLVVYNAFGRTSPTDISMSECEREGRGLGRQKKITVAGKWCGKVWMSNQAHPLLLNKDSQQHEPEMAVASWTKPDVKYVRRTERRPAAGLLSALRKTGKTKKNNLEITSFVKEKPLEAGKLDKSRDFSLISCSNKIKRKCGSRMPKEENPESENLGESSEESQLSDSCKDIECSRGIKRLKKENLEAEENSFEEEHPLSKSWKQIKSKRRARRREKETPDTAKNQKKNKKLELNTLVDEETEGGPSTRLRKRAKKPSNDSGAKFSKPKPVVKTQQRDAKTITKKSSAGRALASSSIGKIKEDEGDYVCDMEGCTMSFCLKQELTLHKRNICPVKGCGKKFFSHKYLVQHRRVHMEDRPLKCPWKGCKMTFKWAWARTEHIRVHTGARPYVCTETGCGQTFRFVSDFSRHKRKTGHAPKKSRR